MIDTRCRQISRGGSPRASPRSRCCSPRSSAAAGCACSSTIPTGVTLALCERVTAALNELRERYSLEVSSPGSERPLTKPAHFRRFVGRRARVRTRHPLRRSGQRPTPARSFTGELVGASEEEVMLAADGGIVAIPYAEIRRSNLVEE